MQNTLFSSLLQSDIQYKYTTGTGLDHSWISAKVDHHYKKFLIDLFRSIILNPAAFYWTLAYHHQVSVCLNFDKGSLLHYWFLNPLKIFKNNLLEEIFMSPYCPSPVELKVKKWEATKKGQQWKLLRQLEDYKIKRFEYFRPSFNFERAEIEG